MQSVKPVKLAHWNPYKKFKRKEPLHTCSACHLHVHAGVTDELKECVLQQLGHKDNRLYEYANYFSSEDEAVYNMPWQLQLSEETSASSHSSDINISSLSFFRSAFFETDLLFPLGVMPFADTVYLIFKIPFISRRQGNLNLIAQMPVTQIHIHLWSLSKFTTEILFPFDSDCKALIWVGYFQIHLEVI